LVDAHGVTLLLGFIFVEVFNHHVIGVENSQSVYFFYGVVLFVILEFPSIEVGENFFGNSCNGASVEEKHC
jgi:hypothetical protein